MSIQRFTPLLALSLVRGACAHSDAPDPAAAGDATAWSHEGEEWRLTGVDTRLQCRRGLSDRGVCQ